ncbi:MAG: hypothetical protein JRH15_01495 [Deltaproteobacteria bacterium]|nr:hypothetical protein [Deltaproteobacteria bacterium]
METLHRAKTNKLKMSLDRHLGCFGNFNRHNLICMRHCVLNMRCSIEQEQNLRLELLEDLVDVEDLTDQIH